MSEDLYLNDTPSFFEFSNNNKDTGANVCIKKVNVLKFKKTSIGFKHNLLKMKALDKLSSVYVFMPRADVPVGMDYKKKGFKKGDTRCDIGVGEVPYHMLLKSHLTAQEWRDTYKALCFYYDYRRSIKQPLDFGRVNNGVPLRILERQKNKKVNDNNYEKR